MKIILVVIISICQALITSIPIYNKKLSDNRYNFPKNLSVAGRWMLVFIIVTICCTLGLYNISETEQAKFQLTLNDTLKHRDFRHQRREDSLSHTYTKQVDSSYKKSSQNFDEVILKYGLHFDSLNNKLVKGIDTMKRQTLVQKISPPEVYLDTIKVISYPNLMKRVTISFKNQKDEAKNVEIKLYAMGIVKETGDFLTLSPKMQRINIEQISSRGFDYIMDFTPRFTIRTYYIFMTGGYYDKNDKYYPFSNLSMLNGNNFRLNFPQGDDRDGLMGMFKKLFPELNNK